MIPTIRGTLIVTALFAGVAPASLAAQSPARAPTGKAAPTACGLLSSAEVAKLLGRPDLASARQVGGPDDDDDPLAVQGSSNGCGYFGTSLVLSVMQVTSVEGFDTAVNRRVAKGAGQSASGLGDAAWFGDNKRYPGFVVRVGTTVLRIQMDSSESGSAEKAKARIRPLAEAAVAKLR